MKIRIYYHDTDCGGVVYYGNYLKYFEQARTEFLEQKGLSIKELADGGTVFVVARQEVDYKAPAVYGDELSIDTRLTKVSGTRLDFEYDVKKQDNKLICTGKTTLACVGTDLKVKPISKDIKEKLAPGTD